jgi:hypothetical protein
MDALYRRSYVAADLMRAHPPQLGDRNKQLVFELAMAGPAPAGTIEVTRWAPRLLPAELELARTEQLAMPGYYDYAGPSDGVWHVNFADPRLFVAYGSPLLAQDELQCAEHPALGSIREALDAEQLPAITDDDQPTPILIAGVERRCTLETAPDLAASRPFGLYGNQFARAEPDAIRRAVRAHRPPPCSNLIAIAAPVGRGRYTRATIERVLVTAVTGFCAAAVESTRRWPGARFEIRTGFWGCGAFGGNRELMTLLQLLAARLAGVDRLRFYAFDDAGRADFEAGAAALERVLAGAATLPDAIARIDAERYVWGQGNGT